MRKLQESKPIQVQVLSTVHAGSENGFPRNYVLVFKAVPTEWDYHDQMNSMDFEK
jgi:hypothetical protein